MRITCSPAYAGKMIGSINLQPSKFMKGISSNSQITDHVDPERIAIPYIEDTNFGSHLDAMKIMKGTYKEEFHVSYDVEFTIDVDAKGYTNIRFPWNAILILWQHNPIKSSKPNGADKTIT